MGGRDPVQQVGGGHVAHGRTAPPLAGQQVVVEQDQDLVGGEVGAGVVDDAQAVRVPVGGDAQVRTGLDDGVAQGGDGPLSGRGHAAPEQGVVAVVDDIHLAAGGQQDRLQARLGDPEHRVQHDVHVGVADGLGVELVDDGVQVPVDGALDGDELAGAGLMGLDATHVGIGQAPQGGGELVSDRLVGVAAAGQEDLDAVVQGRVVGGGHGHPVGGPQTAHRPHGGGGRGGAVDEGDPDAVADEYLNGPPGGGVGQEAAVVADDDALLGRALLKDAVGQPLGQEPDVGAGELIADHGSPAAGAEVDHGGSSAEAPLPGTGRRGG